MKQESAKIIPMNPPLEGVWMEPEVACKYFKHGRGIRFKSLMNKIYAGKLRQYAKWTPQGWYVFVTSEMLNRFIHPLQAA